MTKRNSDIGAPKGILKALQITQFTKHVGNSLPTPNSRSCTSNKIPCNAIELAGYPISF